MHGETLPPAFKATEVAGRNSEPFGKLLLRPTMVGTQLRDPPADVPDEAIGIVVAHAP